MIASLGTARPLALIALLLAACGKGEQDPREEIDDGVALAAADEGPTADFDEREMLPPDEIYYDLTSFDWYRGGEPLVYEGRSFQPVGQPEAIPASDLRPAGRFEGVAYYARSGDTPPFSVLYVPVFEGYWLPFGPVAEAQQQTD